MHLVIKTQLYVKLSIKYSCQFEKVEIGTQILKWHAFPKKWVHRL